MAQNRTLPYGYKIENGKLVTEPQEVKTVEQIYKRYARGESYKKIAEWLTLSGVRYMPHKAQWNKNMVARILQNKNYPGTEKYPAILESDLQQAAEEQIKPYTHTESEDIKNLNPLFVCGVCGEKVRRRLKSSGEERWYCPTDIKHISVRLSDKILLASILNLQKQINQISDIPKAENNDEGISNIELIKLQNQIDLALTAEEPDLAKIKQSIMELVIEKYSLAKDINSIDNQISSVIKNLSNAELNSKELKSITTKIAITHTNATAIVLKNGQKIQLQNAEEGERYNE